MRIRKGTPHLLAAALTLCRLPLQALAADSLDISVILYRDSSCFETFDELLLLDEGCYANSYTNRSQAFSFKLVGFGTQGSADLTEYTDDCHNPVVPASERHSSTNYREGACLEFMAPQSPLYAVVRARRRSNTCVGDSCSRLTIAYQRFYLDAHCENATFDFAYPLQQECMVYFNGTQTFMGFEPFHNITQVDYLGDYNCNASHPHIRTTVVTADVCFGLYSQDLPHMPQSFRWHIDQYTPWTTSEAWRWSRVQQLGGAAATAAVLTATLGSSGSPLLAHTI